MNVGDLRFRVLDARAALRRWWDGLTDTPRRRRRALATVWASGAAVALGLGAGLYLLLRPVPQPDYDTAALDEVFNYTLLTDEFNNLPVERRMELIGKLVQRLRSMDAGESVLLAAFMAGISGESRAFLERNATRLVVDLWDRYAQDYAAVPEDQREAYLEQVFIDMTRTVELATGQVRDVPDSQRINEVREQASRDRAALREGRVRPPPEMIGRMAAFMNTRLSANQNAAQRARGAQMMRDMVRLFRGQDIATGRPK
jgi:hypothetical protein